MSNASASRLMESSWEDYTSESEMARRRMQAVMLLQMCKDKWSVKRGDRFSRACRNCLRENPTRRVISDACGHVVCSRCAYGKNACPRCKKLCTFPPLFEDQMSRECTICFNEEPQKRSFFPSCGHIVCRCCSLRLSLDALEESAPLVCPFCRSESAFMTDLVEELVVDKVVEPPMSDDEPPTMTGDMGIRAMEHHLRQHWSSTKKIQWHNKHAAHQKRSTARGNRLSQPQKQFNRRR